MPAAAPVAILLRVDRPDRTASHTGRRNAATGGFARWCALAFLVCAVAACGSTKRKGPRVVQTDESAAVAATARADWREAADRWYSIHVAEAGVRLEPAYEASRALYELGDLESSGNLVDATLQRFPDNAPLLTLKARILIASNFRRAAEDHLVRSLKARPDDRETLLMLGRLRIDLGLESAAVEPLESYARLTGGGSYESQTLLARAYDGSGAREAAFLAWRRAFSIGQPAVPDLLAAAGTCTDRDVRAAHPQARDLCRQWLARAIESDPNCTTAHFQLGVLSEDDGAYESAIEHYLAAVRTDPSCLVALTNLAILYSGRGELDKARAMVQQALLLERDEARRRALMKLVEPRESDAGRQ